MERRSSQAVRPISQNPAPDWQILGEIELPVGEHAHTILDAWLLDALIPLHLHADFLNKIRKSAEDVVARAIQTDMETQPQRIRLSILVPANHPSDAQTWGFFRIEKVDLAEENKNSPHHTIEFYLFPEEQ